MIEKKRREYLNARIKENSVLRDNGCIEWTGTRITKGYGLIHFAKEIGEGFNSSTTAHRAHYMAYYNVVLTRAQQVLHHCDNPSCVNIEHLFVGTAKDNSQDMYGKGRQRKAESYKLHTRQRVYTNEQIAEIREADESLCDVAERFNVSVSYVSKLRNRKAKTLI